MDKTLNLQTIDWTDGAGLFKNRINKSLRLAEPVY